MPLQQARSKASIEQHGRRPVLTGRGPEAASILQEPAAQVDRFAGSSWTLRASFKMYFGRQTAAIIVA